MGPLGQEAKAAQASLAYEDNKLNFQSCDGKKLTARWLRTGFSLNEAGMAPGDIERPSLTYVDWNGACRTLSWDWKAGRFAVEGDGKTEHTLIVNFVAWDGGKWVVSRGDWGFVMARIAPPDGEVSPAAVNSAAEALEKYANRISNAKAFADALRKSL
jgi:hypothetical protein